jgi:cysteinyl-tRNA synthetase
MLSNPVDSSSTTVAEEPAVPIFETSTGPVTVTTWGYQLQGLFGAPLDPAQLAAAGHDLVVTDFSREGTEATKLTPAEVAAIKDGPGGRSVAAAYLSIGEASEFRTFWDAGWTSNGRASGTLTAAAPDWLGPTNPDWPESRKVRYWDADWQAIIYNDAGTGWLDQIVAQDFDAAYLDIVDAYYFWAVEARAADRMPGDPAHGDEAEAARRMIDFIVDMTTHARQTNPDFFVILQNGEFILDALEGSDPVREAALLDAVGAIAVEDTYYRGDRDENNPLAPDRDKITVLERDFLGNAIPVLVVDYVSRPDLVADLVRRATEDGFIAFAAPDRELDRMPEPVEVLVGDGTPNTLVGSTAREMIDGRAGNDTVLAGDGDDALFGGEGGDMLSGEGGDDRLHGGRGKDRLGGGEGGDMFDFDHPRETRPGAAHRDVIMDFDRAEDRLDLRGIDAIAGGGDQAFRWIGGHSFHGRAGELHYVRRGDHVLVEGDVNGDGRADFQIQLEGIARLGKDDFVL